MRYKVTVVGAGNVGATCAQLIAQSDVADVVMVDVAAELATGKAVSLHDGLGIWDESAEKLFGLIHAEDLERVREAVARGVEPQSGARVVDEVADAGGGSQSDVKLDCRIDAHYSQRFDGSSRAIGCQKYAGRVNRNQP